MSRRRAEREAGSRRSACPVRWAGQALAFLAFLAAAPRLQAQATPAGTQIVASAQATYESLNGLTFSVVSNTVVLVVGQVGGVDLMPPRASIGDPGTTVVFLHTLQNIGNGQDSFTVAVASQKAWTVRLYRDINGNGSLDAGDTPVSGPIALAAGAVGSLLVAEDVPGLASVRGMTDTVRVRAGSLFDTAVADSVLDQLQVRSVDIIVALTKSVDHPSATTGDVLTYAVTYAASGTGTATNFRLVDPIPVGTTYIPGTLRLNGALLTDLPADDAGAFDAVGNRVIVTLASIAGGDSGTMTFQVRVAP
jgi:uncharacterized repeat protein (TIGR01451 family)